MRLKLDVRVTKKAVGVFLLLVLVVAGATFLFIKKTHHNPLPEAVKSQVQFRVVYPTHADTPASSYDYQKDRDTLTFTSKFEGASVAFTEQPAPDKLGSDTQVYYPALGIHPYAQFKTKLGQVALTKFWQSGSLNPVGQAAVLASNGTLVIAHTDKNLTNQQWKDLFDNLKITP